MTSSEGSEVLLVVEDEPSVRLPVVRKLRSLGYFVLEAHNGEDALQVMQEHHAPVHLVITDVSMPEMEGTELVRMLRDWYPQMQVLFISGFGPERVAQEVANTPGSLFLAKPFSLEALAANVRMLLDTEGPGPPTAA